MMTHSPKKDSQKPKLLTIFGTRAEAIKLAPFLITAKADTRFTSRSVSTGQHQEMLNSILQMFNIIPDHDLQIMQPGASLNQIVSNLISKIDEVLAIEQPDAVLVQGDTSTAFAAAIASFHRRIEIIHMEAGLRTPKINSPFPEEAYRRTISQITSLHLAPTNTAKMNLKKERIPSDQIVVTGNTVIDALNLVTQWSTEFSSAELQKVEQSRNQIILVTTHRRENFESLDTIGNALIDLATRNPNVAFVIPLHLNPAVQRALLPKVIDQPNILVTAPLPYDQFIKLMRLSYFILTDSGGIQEEAPALSKPILCMRDSTERSEAIATGGIKLIGTEFKSIVSNVNDLLSDTTLYKSMSETSSPFGDGHATQRTISAILALFGESERLPDFQSN